MSPARAESASLKRAFNDYQHATTGSHISMKFLFLAAYRILKHYYHMTPKYRRPSAYPCDGYQIRDDLRKAIEAEAA